MKIDKDKSILLVRPINIYSCYIIRTKTYVHMVCTFGPLFTETIYTEKS